VKKTKLLISVLILECVYWESPTRRKKW